MQFARQFGLVMFVLATLLPAGDVLAAQDRGNSQFAHDAHKKDKKDKNDKNVIGTTSTPGTTSPNGPVSVPEPGTIVLLGAAAGVVGVRKLRQDRRAKTA